MYTLVQYKLLNWLQVVTYRYRGAKHVQEVALYWLQYCVCDPDYEASTGTLIGFHIWDMQLPSDSMVICSLLIAIGATII